MKYGFTILGEGAESKYTLGYNVHVPLAVQSVLCC
jgi:hypothetical protein